jgi:hypothetical protein
MTALITSAAFADDMKSLPALEHPPKRVILRLRVNEFEGEGRSWQQYPDAIRAYLTWAGRPTSEYEGPYQTRKHFAHVEPFQDPEIKQTRFHVVLDMEQYMLDNPDPATVTHEIYRVRRNTEGDLYYLILPFANRSAYFSAGKFTRFRTPKKQRMSFAKHGSLQIFCILGGDKGTRIVFECFNL